MLTSESDIDQFLILQSKAFNELQAIAGSLGIEVVGDDKDGLVNLIIATKKSTNVYGLDKPQAISLRTKIGAEVINGANDLMRRVRMEMYQFNKKKEFTLINPKDISYQQNMNYLPCSDEYRDQVVDMNMILAKPEQDQIHKMLLHGIDIDKFDINFINKPAANEKSFVMLHVKRT